MTDSPATAASVRRLELARGWGVTIAEGFETPTCLIAYGRRDDLAVVLKVVKDRGDEWRSGEILRAFEGRGVVRVYECVEGAMLLERLDPGTSLVELTCSGRDEEATGILADVIASMSPVDPPPARPTVEDWGRAFTAYLATGDEQVPTRLVRRAAQVYGDLCESQRRIRLLHGDLQHYNILHDHERGWVAIDPKGVIGEVEYEIGASLRNPGEPPYIFTEVATIEKRLNLLSSRLSLDVQRITHWSFAQAVLSLIWGVEDGYTIVPDNPTFQLITALETLSG